MFFHSNSLYLQLCSAGRLSLLRTLVTRALDTTTPTLPTTTHASTTQRLPSLQLDCVDAFGSTALILAAQNGHLEVVRYLLSLGAIDIDAQNKSGMTALICACKSDDLLPLVQLLCNPPPAPSSTAPTTAAASSATPASAPAPASVARKQPQRPANVNLRNRWGDTALLFASKMGNGSVCEWLIRVMKADIHAVDQVLVALVVWSHLYSPRFLSHSFSMFL
jgi:ankyrin repeat protein